MGLCWFVVVAHGCPYTLGRVKQVIQGFLWRGVVPPIRYRYSWSAWLTRIYTVEQCRCRAAAPHVLSEWHSERIQETVPRVASRCSGAESCKPRTIPDLNYLPDRMPKPGRPGDVCSENKRNTVPLRCSFSFHLPNVCCIQSERHRRFHPWTGNRRYDAMFCGRWIVTTSVSRDCAPPTVEVVVFQRAAR